MNQCMFHSTRSMAAKLSSGSSGLSHLLDTRYRHDFVKSPQNSDTNVIVRRQSPDTPECRRHHTGPHDCLRASPAGLSTLVVSKRLCYMCGCRVGDRLPIDRDLEDGRRPRNFRNRTGVTPPERSVAPNKACRRMLVASSAPDKQCCRFVRPGLTPASGVVHTHGGRPAPRDLRSGADLPTVGLYLPGPDAARYIGIIALQRFSTSACGGRSRPSTAPGRSLSEITGRGRPCQRLSPAETDSHGEQSCSQHDEFGDACRAR